MNLFSSEFSGVPHTTCIHLRDQLSGRKVSFFLSFLSFLLTISRCDIDGRRDRANLVETDYLSRKSGVPVGRVCCFERNHRSGAHVVRSCRMCAPFSPEKLLHRRTTLFVRRKRNVSPTFV